MVAGHASQDRLAGQVQLDLVTKELVPGESIACRWELDPAGPVVSGIDAAAVRAVPAC